MADHHLGRGRISVELFDSSDAPINVGWGAKQTQFHGSLGKAAATSSIPPTSVGASPDDDGHVRVSWRGDGALFTVSVLEGANEVRVLAA